MRMRRRGESYSDAIIRVARADWAEA